MNTLFWTIIGGIVAYAFIQGWTEKDRLDAESDRKIKELQEFEKRIGIKKMIYGD